MRALAAAERGAAFACAGRKKERTMVNLQVRLARAVSMASEVGAQWCIEH